MQAYVPAFVSKMSINVSQRH